MHGQLEESRAGLYDIQQVAERLNCSPRHVRRLADAGKIPPPLKLGALSRWRKCDIERFIGGEEVDDA